MEVSYHTTSDWKPLIFRTWFMSWADIPASGTETSIKAAEQMAGDSNSICYHVWSSSPPASLRACIFQWGLGSTRKCLRVCNITTKSPISKWAVYFCWAKSEPTHWNLCSRALLFLKCYTRNNQIFKMIPRHWLLETWSELYNKASLKYQWTHIKKNNLTSRKQQ